MFRSKNAYKAHYHVKLEEKGLKFRTEKDKWWSEKESNTLINLVMNHMNDKGKLGWNEKLLKEKLHNRSIFACREQFIILKKSKLIE